MINVIRRTPQERQPSFSEQIGGALSKGAGLFTEHLLNKREEQKKKDEEKKEEEMLKLQGIDVAGLRPETRKKKTELAFQEEFDKRQHERKLKEEDEKRIADFQNEYEMMKGKYKYERQLKGIDQKNKAEIENKKLAQEKKEKLAPFKSGLKAIDAMEKILNEGNLGVLSKGKSLFSSKTREDRAKYAQLGKSLISMASNIKITNRNEFEVLAHDLYDPSNTDATNRGILEEMKNIIKNNMSAYEDEEENEMVNQQQERPPLSTFFR
jgi:hypothetical protein